MTAIKKKIPAPGGWDTTCAGAGGDVGVECATWNFGGRGSVRMQNLWRKPMAFYHRPRNSQFDPIDPPVRTPPMWIANFLPFFFVAIAVIVLIVMFLPSSTPPM